MYKRIFNESIAEDLLQKYFSIKTKSFLDPEDMREIKKLMPLMDREGIDINSLNIGQYKKNPKQYISSFRNSKRVTNFSR